MVYEFKVNPKAMCLMIDDMDDKKLEGYKKALKTFKIIKKIIKSNKL